MFLTLILNQVILIDDLADTCFTLLNAVSTQDPLPFCDHRDDHHHHQHHYHHHRYHDHDDIQVTQLIRVGGAKCVYICVTHAVLSQMPQVSSYSLYSSSNMIIFTNIIFIGHTYSRDDQFDLRNCLWILRWSRWWSQTQSTRWTTVHYILYGIMFHLAFKLPKMNSEHTTLNNLKLFKTIFRTIPTVTSRSQRNWLWLTWVTWSGKQSGICICICILVLHCICLCNQVSQCIYIMI